MGWAARANPLREQKIADITFLRGWIRRHPEQFKALMQRTTSEPWAVTKAWMRELDAQQTPATVVG